MELLELALELRKLLLQSFRRGSPATGEISDIGGPFQGDIALGIGGITGLNLLELASDRCDLPLEAMLASEPVGFTPNAIRPELVSCEIQNRFGAPLVSSTRRRHRCACKGRQDAGNMFVSAMRVRGCGQGPSAIWRHSPPAGTRADSMRHRGDRGRIAGTLRGSAQARREARASACSDMRHGVRVRGGLGNCKS